MTWRPELHLRTMALLAEVARGGFRPRGSGLMVRRLEEAFAKWVGARHAIGFCNGTATLHAGLVALGVESGDRVATTPLTMAATSAAILAAGAAPEFCDVNPKNWLMGRYDPAAIDFILPVELFGAAVENGSMDYRDGRVYRNPRLFLYDRAQSLYRRGQYDGWLKYGFGSYSFQSSKHLSAGEGGMLVTDSDDLANRARSFASLGYDLSADSRIDRMAIRDPEAIRHVRFGVNYRMNDLTAAVVLAQLEFVDHLLAERLQCAELYRQAHQGCDWLTAQHVPEGASHNYWAYALLMSEAALAPRVVVIQEAFGRGTHRIMADGWKALAATIRLHGGEKPYACWRLTFEEPAFKHLDPGPDACPVARSIQPRLMLFQTNDLAAAEKNAEALRRTIREIGG